MKKFSHLILAWFAILLACLPSFAQAQQVASGKGTLVRVTPKLSEIDRTTMYGQPLVITRDMNGLIGVNRTGKKQIEREILEAAVSKTDNAVQNPTTIFPQTPITTLGPSFDGLTWPGLDPSDNNCAVGPNHVIQVVNNVAGSQFKIWNKTGGVVQNGTTIASLTGITGWGDPVVLYDQIANRWFLSEFGVSGGITSYANTLITAVSVTADPTGAWKIYSFRDDAAFWDYPKFAVWHNAYYASTNDFNTSGTAYLGSSVWAFDRTAMIAGAPTANWVRTRLTGTANYYNMSVCSQEGPTSSTQSGLYAVPVQASSHLRIFEFTPNFAVPASSVVGPETTIPVAAFTVPPASVAQQGSGSTVQTLGYRFMFKMNYRKNVSNESVLITHTVGGSPNPANVRWYELRRTAGTWGMYQQGTVTGADGNSRFMPSMTMDANGNIALLYNLSGTTAFPSIKYTARNECDPLGQMTLPEQTIINGTAAHTLSQRWGDYNAVVADPTIVGSYWSTAQYSAGAAGSSRVANFTISGGAATFSSHPSDISVCVGTSATFTVVANGNPPITYQWEVSADGGTTWNPIGGATAATYTFTAAAGDNGKKYRCVATSSCGAGTSNAATLTITTLSQGGTITPAATSYCLTTNSTTLTLGGSIGNIIRWESSIDGGTTWVNIANTTTTQTATNIAVTTMYRALVQSSGCSSAYSATATITILPGGQPLQIVADNGTTLCAGDPTRLTVVEGFGTQVVCATPSITINSSGAASPYPANLTVAGFPTTGVTVKSVTLNGLNHTWASDMDIVLQSPSGQNVMLLSDAGGSADFINNTMIFDDAAAAIFAAPPAAGATATVKPTNTAGPDAFPAPGPASVPANPTLSTFTGDFNGVWKLFINDQAAGDQGTVSGGYCITFVGPPASTVTGGTFLWTPAAGLSSTTTNPVAASPATTTTYTVTHNNGAGCTRSATITITVNQRPAVTTPPASITVCQGQPATFTVAATGTTITYQWQVSSDGGVTYTDIPAGAPYAGVTTATLSVNPTTAAMNNNRYRCVISGICNPAATSAAAVLTINPLPVIPITPAGPICGGIPGINGVLLTAGSSAPPVPGSVTVNSGPLTLAIPDASPAGVTNNLAVSTLPANATITGMAVTLNMTHTWAGDMVFALKAPSGSIFNLDWFLNGSGGAASTGFVNTVISSTGTALLSTGTSPYTGTFAADARMGTVANPAGPTGMLPTTSSFAAFIGSIGTGAGNGTYTLGMYDGGAGDNGTLTSWSIKFDYTTPGPTGAPLTYTWSPAAGLFTNPTATAPYIAGTQTATVYAAPSTLTVYTVTGTNATTGCVGTNSVTVNYTPPAPTVTPTAVTMCLGDPAVRLTSASSTTTVTSFASGALAIPIIDNSPGGTLPHTINVAGIPAGAVVTGVAVNLNLTHTYVGDMSINLKAPNGNILNLDRNLTATGNAGANFVNTVISSSGTTALSSGAQPFTGTFKADIINGTVTPGYTFGDPTGYVANAVSFANLYSVPNGGWTIAMADNGAIDVGTFNSWTLTITYVTGVPATPAIWSPTAGLFINGGATPYTGDARDTVWAQPTTIGANPYTATVQSLPVPPSSITTTFANNNAFSLVTSNFKNNNSFPVTITGFESIASASGGSTARLYYKTSAINGLPGAISAANGWTLAGSGTYTAVANTTTTTPQAMLSGLSVTIPAGATYGIAVESQLTGGAGNLRYSTVAAGTYTNSASGCDLISGTNVSYAGDLAPIAPTFTPRAFIGKILFSGASAPACTSPARTVVVTVNQPALITGRLSNATVCTDKVTSFTVTATGTGPTYAWQVSTDNGNTFSNVANGGVYSGATSSTLVITAPPVTMNGYFYRVRVTGTAPCGSVISDTARLNVNPLPVVVISANPSKLLPGLTTAITSSSTTIPATNVWRRNGSIVGGNTASLPVNVDGLGEYGLTVTDVNGCVGTSNLITIADSVSGRVFIYPNPNNGVFQVRYHSVMNNVLPRGLNVYDAKGARISTNQYMNTAPYSRMDVDLREFGSGVYWIEVVDRNGDRLAMGRAVVVR